MQKVANLAYHLVDSADSVLIAFCLEINFWRLSRRTARLYFDNSHAVLLPLQLKSRKRKTPAHDCMYTAKHSSDANQFCWQLLALQPQYKAVQATLSWWNQQFKQKQALIIAIQHWQQQLTFLMMPTNRLHGNNKIELLYIIGFQNTNVAFSFLYWGRPKQTNATIRNNTNPAILVNETADCRRYIWMMHQQ